MSRARLVSVVIPTCNRYGDLLRAIDSVKGQRYGNVEVVVVNDRSTSAEYYGPRPAGVRWIDLEQNTRERFGYPSPGTVRNAGIHVAEGEYLAFLDDDDVWLEQKLEVQLAVMEAAGSGFSCTEAYYGLGDYDPGGRYPVYHRGHYEAFCRRFFKGREGGWSGQLPDVFTLELIQEHNFIITSSVVLHRSVIDAVGGFKDLPIGEEDAELWRRVLGEHDCLHVNEPLLYYKGRAAGGGRVRRALRRLRRALKGLASA